MADEATKTEYTSWDYFLDWNTQRRALMVAIIVGTILNLINQWDAIFGAADIVVLKALLTYCVPYCVSSFSSVAAARACAAGEIKM